MYNQRQTWLVPDHRGLGVCVYVYELGSLLVRMLTSSFGDIDSEDLVSGILTLHTEPENCSVLLSIRQDVCVCVCVCVCVRARVRVSVSRVLQLNVSAADRCKCASKKHLEKALSNL